MTDDIFFYSTGLIDQVLYEVMTNDDYAAETSLLHDQKDITLTFIVSGCSGKLKLRKCYGKTHSGLNTVKYQ